ncbi:MAG: transposase, partial [Acidobacteriia bacterium]|nr:transposase [Terriglobia bacterium]
AARAVLYRAVAGAVETFLAIARERDRVVPRFVEREFRAYLECGILAHGFLRVHCDACGHDRLVPFSCKGRGFCPSCGGRRMADTAAHLVDGVFPEVPVRQWVLTVPVSLRYLMAFDAGLTAEVLRAFVRVLFASLRRRARERQKIRYADAGAVTFVQRFGDALNLNVHFHALALDGVFDADDPGELGFVPLDPPDDAEILRVARGFARRLASLLERRGLGVESDAGDTDPLVRDQPLMAELCGASVRGRVATGPRAGQRLRRREDRIDVEHLLDTRPPGCVSIGGISVHAAVAVPARDRRRLERLCRYAARPALAAERLCLDPDGRLVYRLRHRWRDGTTHLLLDPLELMERLAVLVPPPRFHLVRYHGILAPRAAWRDRVVPAVPRPHENPDSSGTPRTGAAAPDQQAAGRETAPAQRGRRLPWAKLLQRVFGAEALTCPRCGRPMRILAAIQSPAAIRAILECLGLPPRPPPVAPPAVDRLLSADA